MNLVAVVSFSQGIPLTTGYAGFFSTLDFEISTDMGCLVYKLLNQHQPVFIINSTDLNWK